MVKLIRFDDPPADDIELQVFELVSDVSGRYGVSPSMSTDAEQFFSSLLAEYTGDLENLTSWLEERLSEHFVAVGARPSWLQGPEWPFANGRPMIFVGQIDLTIQNGGIASELYHDDTSLYVFIGRKVQPEVVVQQK